MTDATSFVIEATKLSTRTTHMLTFTSAEQLVAAVNWMIELLPDELCKSEARVGLMLTLRHNEES